MALDFIVVTPAAMTYCEKFVTVSLHAAGLKEKEKIQKYADAYKERQNIHFISIVLESGGAFEEKAQDDVFHKICNLITHATSKTSLLFQFIFNSFSMYLGYYFNVFHCNINVFF